MHDTIGISLSYNKPAKPISDGGHCCAVAVKPATPLAVSTGIIGGGAHIILSAEIGR